MNRGKKFLKFLLLTAIISTLFFVVNNSKVFAKSTQTNSVTKTTQKSIKGFKVETNCNKTFEYTGKPRKISVKLYDGKKLLQDKKDYNVTYVNNINPGNATATIKGKGDYTGEIKVKFYIGKPINNFKITTNTNKYFTYTGNKIKISVKLYDGKKLLQDKKDYNVTYVKNIKPGKATATIKGKGKYCGSIKVVFYIAPKKAVIRDVVFNSSFTRATISWNRDGRASGYKVYMAESANGPYKRIKKITDVYTTSYTKKGLDPNKIYYFKVRAYKEVDGGKKQIARLYSDPKSNSGLIASVTLNSPNSGTNRNYNLSKACQIITGKVIKPGDTFNWFRDHGPASSSRGFRQAIVYEGNRSVLGSGGGVCQVSTTIYQAARKVGLKIVERHAHSKPVSYTTIGNDATVYYGVDNLIIKNNKNYKIKLVLYAQGGKTTCQIYRVS